ncbi:hypothetical protein JG687_00014119 [Phytophthora cactorum]|uniref:Uncharacterized protein n=1 Tax=Phytophthora cactorum TaxID=29920 RepID=A0A8T1TX01_9STRA|nr:hypothetical protein JG687_00014119 [Phytophthora cactorum]
MQFKVKMYIVDTTKSEQGWEQWLVKMRGDSPGETVTLLIYEYGVAITETQDILAFRQACIRPEQTDRADAPAENYLGEVVARLRAEMGGGGGYVLSRSRCVANVEQ